MSDKPATWKVTLQQQATGQDATGNYVRGRNVTWQLADGTTGTVFIPKNSYTADFVKQAIVDDVAQVASIGKLTSES